jgi:hypothetical protein
MNSMLRFFKSSPTSEIQKLKSELKKEDLIKQESTINDLEGLKKTFEMMKSYGVKRFDSFFNLCIISSIANSDIMLLKHQIALTDQKLEKLLAARMLALVMIEYLQDINDLLGNKLVCEMNENGFAEFVPRLRELNSDFAQIRKKHQSVLTTIRNNISAHKTKNGLSLINQIFNLDSSEIMEMGNEICIVDTNFTKETTKIIYRILADAEEKSKNSQ